MTVILTDTSQLDSFCLLEEKHRLIYIHVYFGSAPKIEGFERFLLLSSTIHFSALENNRDFWSFFSFFPTIFPGALETFGLQDATKEAGQAAPVARGRMVLEWSWHDAFATTSLGFVFAVYLVLFTKANQA